MEPVVMNVGIVCIAIGLGFFIHSLYRKLLSLNEEVRSCCKPLIPYFFYYEYAEDIPRIDIDINFKGKITSGHQDAVFESMYRLKRFRYKIPYTKRIICFGKANKIHKLLIYYLILHNGNHVPNKKWRDEVQNTKSKIINEARLNQYK